MMYISGCSFASPMEIQARMRRRNPTPNIGFCSKYPPAVKPDGARPVPERSFPMLGWALVFLVVALIAGLFGFTGLAVASAGIAQILFYIFVVLFVVSSLVYLIRGRAPPTV